MIRPPFLLPERLPSRSPKPYIRLQRMGAQAVTIAAGFQCSDGVVLCADTEINVTGFVKFPGSKFRLYPRMACCPVFTFAGDVLYCEMLVRHIAESVLVAERQGSDVLAAAQAKALSIHQVYAAEGYEAGSGLIMSLWLGTEGKRTVLAVWEKSEWSGMMAQVGTSGSAQLRARGHFGTDSR